MSYKSKQKDSQSDSASDSGSGSDSGSDSLSRSRSYSSNSESYSSSSQQSMDEKQSLKRIIMPGKISRFEQPKFKFEETKTLCIQKIASTKKLQTVMTDISIAAGTSVPDQIQFKDGNAFIKYPSVQVASKVLNYIKGSVYVLDKPYNVIFWPIRKVDANIQYDWHCQKCDYKNFARRNKCYKCDTQKTDKCRLIYAMDQNGVNRIGKQDNCSIMIRGAIISEIQDLVLLDVFEQVVKVRDIRMIKNKATNKYKDFAFVQFYTPQQTALAMKFACDIDFRVAGQKVSVMYSRNKTDHDFQKSLPYERRDRRSDRKSRKRETVDNYYKRQREKEIEQEKQKPLITMEQLKEKKDLEMRKAVPVLKQMTQEQNKRKKAQQFAKQWSSQPAQLQILYICVICKRKFMSQQDMKIHQKQSQYHQYLLKQFNLI